MLLTAIITTIKIKALALYGQSQVKFEVSKNIYKYLKSAHFVLDLGKWECSWKFSLLEKKSQMNAFENPNFDLTQSHTFLASSFLIVAKAKRMVDVRSVMEFWDNFD